MSFPLSNDQIAHAIHVSPDAVATNWPPLEETLNKHNVYSDNVAVAVIGTVRVECGSKFAPIHEFGNEAYFKRMYDIEGANPHLARNLGNFDSGDGARYHGRGYLQLTGRANYQHFGVLLGIDLLSIPDLALKPDVAAEVLVNYFVQRGCIDAANKRDWLAVRRKVNGGDNGLGLYLQSVNSLISLLNV